ncbi:MAG: hypothetical protein FJX37_08845 [Alphaproteobacteria bacterium]|nr:hypothetical protein [Alphaproteobacteria bacterium]
MSESFTGKFLKPTEAFAVQNLDPTHLNRLGPEVLIWFLAAAVVGLAVHFLTQTVPGMRRKEQP